ncbi:MAG: hypothetical protein R6X35_03355 [Candidatus Krumholzibacteriia bacterium]
MTQQGPESDWKVFRELREAALQRFCRRALAGVDRLLHDEAGTDYDRYVAIARWLHERDQEMKAAFDDPRRSMMLLHLHVIASLGLLEPGELEQFTPETVRSVEAVLRSDDD